MTEPGRIRAESLVGRRLLVTGGAGFIGSHLVERALTLGAKLRVLDDFSTGSLQNLAACLDDIEVLTGDISDLALCQKAMHGVELVLHCAAIASVDYSLESPARTLQVNVTGTANILQAARDAGVERLVYASSSSVYGTGTPSPQREGHEGTLCSAYALSKSMDEQLAAFFHQCYGTAALGLRFFNVYGARQSATSPYSAVVSRFLHALQHGQSLMIHGTGAQSRDFVHISDVTDAVLLALTSSQVETGTYNVGTGLPTTVLQLAQLVAALSPGSVDLEFAPPRPNDLAESYADMSQFVRTFGKKPRISLTDGLRMTAENYLG